MNERISEIKNTFEADRLQNLFDDLRALAEDKDFLKEYWREILI